MDTVYSGGACSNFGARLCWLLDVSLDTGSLGGRQSNGSTPNSNDPGNDPEHHRKLYTAY